MSEHARAALNFNLVMMFALLLAAGLSCFLVGVPVGIALFVLGILFPVQGAVAAYEGKDYDYPLTIELV